MTVAYFDTIAGISGDMSLGALVSAGVPLDVVTSELQKLKVQGFEIQGSHIERNGIIATKIDVVTDGHGHAHRHLNDITKIIDQSALSAKVKEISKRIFCEVAVGEAKVHATSPGGCISMRWAPSTSSSTLSVWRSASNTWPSIPCTPLQ